jgi:hypothetical protein
MGKVRINNTIYVDKDEIKKYSNHKTATTILNVMTKHRCNRKTLQVQYDRKNCQNFISSRICNVTFISLQDAIQICESILERNKRKYVQVANKKRLEIFKKMEN